MLWLALAFPSLPATALGLDPELAAVTDQRASRRWLITPTAGLPAGTALSCALAREPSLPVHPRKPAAEQSALQGLAWWAYRYGSPVVCEIVDLAEPGRCPRARLWLEAGASLKLFGGYAALRRRMLVELAELGHGASSALAPTRAGAALLAEAGADAACLDPGTLEHRLSRLPLAALPWPGEILGALRGVGLSRLGEIFALPRESFAQRFGRALLNELDRMRGLAPEAFAAVTPPPRYARRFELAGEIETVEPLLFPLKRMCAELAAYLRARDTGVCGVRLACAHALGAPTRLELRFLAPTREAARLFAALDERLMRDPPRAPVRELLLEADDFATPQPLQGDLFDGSGLQKLEWEQALERIAARLSEGALWTPACVEDHRPERAHASLPPGGEGAALPAPRPAWLLKEPRRLSAPPSADADAAGELIEGGWWDGHDVRRLYRNVPLDDGARAWAYQDVASRRWYLHGLWG